LLPFSPELHMLLYSLTLVVSALFGGVAAYTTPVEAQKTDDHWAVLIAGSSGYGNYRHQADVCHAYHVMINGGISAEKIIVLAVDDIANNRENPFPGKIFNKPTPAGTPGVDVYEGCIIDYSGKDVTPDTFAKVLTGDSSGLVGVGSGKVLGSTSNDRVFVNFVDHGGVGLIGFPSGMVMHSKELIAALTTMHTNSMYKELVFYLEACESGSMFEGVLDDSMSIYATTASNAKESSWGTYCSGDDAKVDGKAINSCLGDLYSVNWMEDQDSIADSETLDEQFTTVKQLTDKSHVMQYGDVSFTSEPTSNFEGKTDKVAAKPVKKDSSLPSRDAEIASAYMRFMATGEDTAAEDLIRGVQERQRAKRRFSAITSAVAAGVSLPEHDLKLHLDCHFAAHKEYVAKCGGWDSGALPYSATLAQLCAHTGGQPSTIVAAIDSACAA